MAASSLGQGEIAMQDVGRSSRQDDQITGEGQGEKAIAMEDVGQSSRQDDQITGEGAHENNAGDIGEGQGEIAIAMEDVGQSSRQDDQITSEGAHENNAGDTGEGQGEIAIVMEDVGQSSRQDDQITGEGAHENNAGDTGEGQGEIAIAMEDVGQSSRQDDQITGEGQGEKAIAMEDVGQSSRQDDQITGEGQGEKAIAMEDVGQSSRQDDQITSEGAHENNAGDIGEGQGEIAIAMEDVGQSSRQDDQITSEGAHENNAGDTGEGQGEIAIVMEDVGQSSRQDDQITGEGAHENNAGDTGEGQGEIAIAMEDVGQSSRQDDQITGEGAHENTAGDTEAGDTHMDPELYRYATTSRSGVICLCQEFIRDMRTRYFAGATGAISNIPEKVRANKDKVSFRGNTVLHLAANTGHVQLIELITRDFPELVRKRNHDGELPLHVAASAGHLSAVRKLVERNEGDTAQGHTSNEKDERGNTALHVAVENNHQDVAMFLVGKDGSGSTSHSTNKSGKTPLCMAAETANLELVKAMVDKTPNSTADANSGNFWQGSNGNSILRSAIIWRKQAKGGLKSYDAVFVLVMLMLWIIDNPFIILLVGLVWALGTNIAKGSLKKYDAVFVLIMPMLWYINIPLFLPGVVCWSKVSQWRLPRTNRKKYTSMPPSLLFSAAVFVLVMSIFDDSIDQLFSLAAVVCWIFFKSIVSQRWLPRTNRKKYTNLLETILSKMDSADLINSTDQEWMTPLTLAAYMDNFVAVRVLLHKFTGLAYKGDENQLLPIHVASKKGHCRVVEEFLNHCPDLRESSDREGRNILHVAAAHGRVNVVRYIIGKRDLQVLSKQRDQSGNTPLHIAVQNWHPKIVIILSLFHAYERANLNSLNNAGETALDLAEKTGVDKEMFFRRKLALMALNLADAPRSEERTATKAKLVEDSVLKSSHNSDNLMFSKESVNTLLLVSTLVVSITFVQAFTIPGGYTSSGNDVGTPIFLTHSLFKIFLICNTVAMCGSITASIALMWAQTHDPKIIYAAMRFTLPVLGVTLTMMSSSFLAGVALTVYHDLWLRIFVYAMGFFFTVFIIVLLAPLIDVPVAYVPPSLRGYLILSLYLLMFVSGYNFDDDWSNRWSL